VGAGGRVESKNVPQVTFDIGAALPLAPLKNNVAHRLANSSSDSRFCLGGGSSLSMELESRELLKRLRLTPPQALGVGAVTRGGGSEQATFSIPGPCATFIERP